MKNIEHGNLTGGIRQIAFETFLHAVNTTWRQDFHLFPNETAVGITISPGTPAIQIHTVLESSDAQKKILG